MYLSSLHWRSLLAILIDGKDSEECAVDAMVSGSMLMSRGGFMWWHGQHRVCFILNLEVGSPLLPLAHEDQESLT